jgi:hypothetical protein
MASCNSRQCPAELTVNDRLAYILDSAHGAAGCAPAWALAWHQAVVASCCAAGRRAGWKRCCTGRSTTSCTAGTRLWAGMRGQRVVKLLLALFCEVCLVQQEASFELRASPRAARAFQPTDAASSC